MAISLDVERVLSQARVGGDSVSLRSDRQPPRFDLLNQLLPKGRMLLYPWD